MILGLDVGTGGSRAVLVDQQGAILASATRPHAPFTSPGPAWAEQDPEDWWHAAAGALRDVLAAANVRASDIAGIGLSGQMHGAVLLDGRGEVIRPAIIWCDQRTAGECRWLHDEIGPARLLELTSNPALTNFTLTKLLWVRRNEPDRWARVAHVLLPKDYVRYRLSGAFATDVADASGTLLLDVAGRQWSAEMLDAVELSRALLPDVFESPAVTAAVSADAARVSGLAAGTPIVAGAGDQAAGAVGMGITRPGAVSVTIGTSGVVFAATERPALDRRGRIHTFCHAVPDRWHVMGVTQAAGLSLRWLRDQWFGDASSGEAAYDRITAEAAGVPPGSDGVLWAPYLMGERTPHCDPDVRAALVGLAATHSRGHVARAVLEGVAFSLKDSFAVFEELGLPVTTVRVGGGGARSALWRDIQATVYGRPVVTVAAEEGAAYGAALLAGVGAGAWPSVDEACDRVVHTSVTTPPLGDAVATMRGQYERYRRIYPALRSITRLE
ncbi:MAG: xylulokinase [Acidobacteria bacterium]|nr:xylulokinase [Acidobacteriota bacterium]